jgi:hypothetical protein
MKPLKASWYFRASLVLALLGIWFACSTDRTMKPQANQPPETHLFLHFSDTLQLPGETTSMQVLHWYGDDPDGEVVGFEWAWDDTSAWTWTTAVKDTFYVPIRVPQDTFVFYIRAVDNDSMRDPTPDHLSFPIKNSPPTVSFPVDFTQRYARVVYNSFSYFSIGWSGSDPDGDATITGYDWYLADSSFMPIDSVMRGNIYWNETTIDTMSWQHLDSLATLKIFRDLQPGSYRFFLRCRDVAAAYSPIVFYPDTNGVWNVMPVHGSVLFVDDDRYASGIDSVIPNSISNIYGPGNFSTWNVIDRVSYYPRDIEETLKLFDVVVWHGGSYPHFKDASDAINGYLASGGRLLAFSTQRFEGDTTIYPFMPMDSVTNARIPRSFRIIRVPGAPEGFPDTLSSNVPGYPSYPLSKSYGFAPGSPSGLLPGTVQALYTQIADATPDRIDTVAAKYPATGQAQIVYFSMELYLCSARFEELLRYVLLEEFQHAGF